MTAEGLRTRFGLARSSDERRAVIDIGSNTVRLVIYGGPPRAPAVLWNEKVSARLGRDLARTGAIPVAAMDEALAALARYAQILQDLGIGQVEAVATAAPRDASNGAQFLASVAALGIDVRLLSGEEEAQASAYGAIGAFPGADGIVADLGGGSLELVPIAGESCGSGASLPLGTLRLPALRAENGFARNIGQMLAELNLPPGARSQLYMIGGTWRAFAIYAMRAIDHPLTDPHGFRLDAREANELAARIERSEPAKLAQVRGLSTMRAEKLPDAAALLRALLEHVEPQQLIFSSWGLREGLHFRRLDGATRSTDPLLAGVTAFASTPLPGQATAQLLADWISQVAAAGDAVSDRLRLAAAHLAPALHGVEPNLRSAQAVEWALDKRWIAIEPGERALLAAMLVASLGHTALPERVTALAPPSRLAAAIATGRGLRLAQRLGAGARESLLASRLVASDGTLILALSAQHAVLATPMVGKDLAALAKALDLRPELTLES